MVPPRWNHPLCKNGNPHLLFFLVLTVSLRSGGMSVNFLKRDGDRDLCARFIADMLFALAMALLLIWRSGRGSYCRRGLSILLRYRHIAK